jgi:hypothetical protein
MSKVIERDKRLIRDNQGKKTAGVDEVMTV